MKWLVELVRSLVAEVRGYFTAVDDVPWGSRSRFEQHVFIAKAVLSRQYLSNRYWGVRRRLSLRCNHDLRLFAKYLHDRGVVFASGQSRSRVYDMKDQFIKSDALYLRDPAHWSGDMFLSAIFVDWYNGRCGVVLKRWARAELKLWINELVAVYDQLAEAQFGGGAE